VFNDKDILYKHLTDLIVDLEQQLYSDKILSIDYDRRMLRIAYELALLGYPDDALLTFIGISSDYFRKYGLNDLLDSEEFSQKMEFLAVVFDYDGRVPLSAICNSPPAIA
jgi:hypothetical protein